MWEPPLCGDSRDAKVPPTLQRSLQRLLRLLRVGRDPQAHRDHRRLDKAVLAEKFLGHVFRPIGQQRDAEKILLPRKFDRVLEQLRAVAVLLELFMDDEVFEQNDEPTFGRADGEKQVDHPDNGAVAAQYKHASAAGLLEDQTQSAQLFLFVGPKITLLREESTEHFR